MPRHYRSRVFPNLLATSLSPPKNPSVLVLAVDTQRHARRVLFAENRERLLLSLLFFDLFSSCSSFLSSSSFFFPSRRDHEKLFEEGTSNRRAIETRSDRAERRSNEERERGREIARERERKKSEERKHAERKGTRPYGELVPESTATLNYNQSATDFY